MALWLVRAGSRGEREDLALEQNVAVIGWEELPDLSQVQTREELEQICHGTYPDEKHNTIVNWVGQIWTFMQRIQEGDLVVLPLKHRAVIAIGEIRGPYQYRSDYPRDARHTRAVEWLQTDIPRTAFDQDLLHSMGAFLTVCRIQRNDAENRVRRMLQRPLTVSDQQENGMLPEDDGERIGRNAPIDLEEYARDQIRDYISRKFRGHALSRLLRLLLEVQGYKVEESPPGPDGGVDLIAGRGPLGFDPPRLCVQIKSGDSPLDVKVFRELQGVMRNFGAEQGLLVSWGGFRRSVYAEARRNFFEIRLWDSNHVIDSILVNYDKLPDEFQAELPLKRMWTLVLED